MSVIENRYNQFDRARYLHANADQLASETVKTAEQKLNALREASENLKSLNQEIHALDGDQIVERLDKITQELKNDNLAHPGQIVFEPEDF
jgi:hypothetical protein